MDFRALHKTTVGEKYVVDNYETKNDNKRGTLTRATFMLFLRLPNFSMIPHIFQSTNKVN